MTGAVAYKRHDDLFLHSSSRTTAGVWIASSPFIKVESDSTLFSKGEALIKILNASQENVPHPTNWSGLIGPLLELAGVKTWSTFMKKARCLNLEADSGQLKIIPNRNLGPKSGFEPNQANSIELPFSSSTDQIGAALEEGFSRCQ